MELSVYLEKKLRDFTLQADFTVRDEVFALLGASGCGKSMTLKCIAGIEKPDKGRIVLDGQVLFDSEKGIDLPPQKRQLGYLFQNYALFPNMTVAENLRFVMKEASGNKVLELLQRFQLEGLENAYPAALSGGQQQRVLLARALCATKKMLLLDEPVTGLDPIATGEMYNLIKLVNLCDDITVIMVSHDIHAAARYSTHILHLGQKQLFFGTAGQYRESAQARRFLGGNRI